MTKRARSNREEFVALPELPQLHKQKYRSDKTFSPKNDSQRKYLSKINSSTITICTGPAGTGKTFVAAMAAHKAFSDGLVDKIIITRPVVEAGEKLGFLPGDLKEKYEPYVAPFVEALSRVMGTGHVEALISNGRIEFLPLAFMRGHSWDNTFVILDEAQNITKEQMKLFLTRIGQHTKVVVDGDISQKDIPVNGLEDAIHRLACVPNVSIHRFTSDDIVRSGIVKDIILAYDDKFEPVGSDDGLLRFLTQE